MFDGGEIAKRALIRAGELKAERKRRRAIQGTLSLIGSCAVCAIALFLFFGGAQEDYIHFLDEPMPLAEFPLSDENTGPSAGQIMQIPDIGKIAIAADTVEIALLLQNPKENTLDCVFEIILSETGEILCKTEPVEPGMYIEHLTLSKPLAKGDYNAVLKIGFESENPVLSDYADVCFTLSAE